MEEGDVIGGGLVPANQDAPKGVQPTVGAFHHPTPGLEACFFFDGLRLFATAAKLLQSSPHLIEVITPVSSNGRALIQAQTLGCSPLCGGRCTSRLSTVARTSFMSWRLAPATASPTEMPWASVNRLCLTPLLPRSVRLGPVFPSAQGGLGHGPVHAQPTPVQTIQFVVPFQPRLP